MYPSLFLMHLKINNDDSQDVRNSSGINFITFLSLKCLGKNVKYFPVWLRNRLLSTGLEPVLSQTEKSCIASNYRQFSTNIKIKII